MFSLFSKSNKEKGQKKVMEDTPYFEVKTSFDGKDVFIRSGEMARQSNGAVIVVCGHTHVLVTVCAKSSEEDRGFLPLVVDYREKKYAVGEVPSNFFRREARPTEGETLTMRLIDRPLRPLFPEGFSDDIQIMATVLSHEKEHSPDVLAILGASAALAVSDIPFDEYIGAVRVGKKDGKLIFNPTLEEREDSSMDLVVAGTESSIVMVEGSADEVSEDELIEALEEGSKVIVQQVLAQKELREQIGKEKYEFYKESIPEALENDVKERLLPVMKEAFFEKKGKKERDVFVAESLSLLKKAFAEEFEEKYSTCCDSVDECLRRVDALAYRYEKKYTRQFMLESQKRDDGRDPQEIRPITCRTGVLPAVHGSALFTRGETQALVVTTLGTEDDALSVDKLDGMGKTKFFLHYNFPPYSVGEVKPVRSVSRREIGHGHLAEKSLSRLVPQDNSPYTIRIVSDILESNGSSSMASVCGGSLALFDAGIKIPRTVAGIAMGLIYENGESMVLSDIAGIEDHLGDMDFKVAGTSQGITGFQMDIKVKGISFDILKKAIMQASEGRDHIIQVMESCLDKPREDVSEYAPAIISITIPRNKIREVIGQGGRVIKAITEKTGARINIEDSGKASISGANRKEVDAAQSIIEEIIEGPVIGRNYQGAVTCIKDFGAFVEIIPGCEGLLHVSQISNDHVENVGDILSEGQEVTVCLYNIDGKGRYNLSMKNLSETEES